MMDYNQTMLGIHGHSPRTASGRNTGHTALRVAVLGILSSVLISLGLISGCSRNAATGEEHLNFYSEAQEIQMGQQADSEIVATMGLYPDQNLQQWIQRFGADLASRSERPNLPWTFRVVDDPVVNAFALPGGFIYVTRGLMTHVSNEAELAGVVGHEIGHVTAQHTVHRMSTAQVTQLGVAAGMMLKPGLQRYGQLIGTGLNLLFLKFSRSDESQADHLGLRYLTRANYDAEEMPSVFVMLNRVSQAQGGGRIPEWLATHPDPGNREAAIKKELDTMGVAARQGKVGTQEYLALIDGMVYGDNPREGFFKNGVFYQPDMKFQYQFPAGWQTSNQKQGVVAVSKNQDAVLQITLAPANSVQDAANKFFSQQGLQATNPQQRNMNGFSTVSGQFAANTDQGQIQGIATFIEYGGNVFQVLGYTTAQGWGNYAQTFASSMQTFSRLTDPGILAVQPMRLKVVRLNNAASLAQVARQYNASVTPDELAIINQVPNDAKFSSGEEVKVVVGNRSDAGVLSR